MSKRFYWLKLQENFFSDPKIKKLRRIAGGDTFTIIYLKMQLLSVKSGGILSYTGIEETFEDELSLIMDEDVDNIRLTVSYLISQGLMEQSDDGNFLLPQAAESIGSESESKERVRAYRERKLLRESIPLRLVRKISHEQIALPDGNTKFIDNKRYGGNGEYVYELAECKCEICGNSNSKDLLIHHNNGYSNDLDDLYLLCRTCHFKVERGLIKCEKHKRKCVTSNAIVTECNTEKEIEKRENSKEKRKDILDEEKEQKPKRKYTKKPFVPPTLQEVEEYCRERNSCVDPKRFYDYFSTPDDEGRTWIDSKGNPVRNWKQKIIVWEGSNQNSSKSKSNQPEERDYSFVGDSLVWDN